ncbi:MAG TPA: methylmalonyl-CoA epimerase [Bryobacteraceae bacterium]|jgi:methylmalonyl-CoA epimerase
MSIEIDHVGIAVRSIDESLRFYQLLLGLDVTGRENVAEERVTVAMLSTTPRIELLESAADGSTIAKFIAKRGPGLHHIALRVDNISSALDRLKAAGAKLLNEPRRGAGGHTYVFVHPAATGGVLLELIQK